MTATRLLALLLCATIIPAQQPASAPGAADPIAALVGQLDLARYKATIKGLTRFGDRRQGTDRNRAAIDWIESQLKSYGCANTERIHYNYQPAAGAAGASGGSGRGAGGSSGRGGGNQAIAPGGGRRRGYRIPDAVNNDPMKQPDPVLRELDMQPSAPGPREEVYCTKVGTTHPEEMYIVGAHMDGHGWGEAANDDGSGTALVMELARVLNAPGVTTERSIRFALWNNEETGLNGARAYVDQRKDLQGKESPAGSGRFPEPKWLGMIQHDMMLFDHVMPHKDGTMSKEQRPEADVNIEYQLTSNEKYATDYPANIGPHMTNTDSTPFMDLTPAISLREAERGAQLGNGWDPHHHQPTDLYATFNDDDFRLGLNAAQTALAAIAQLSGAKTK